MDSSIRKNPDIEYEYEAFISYRHLPLDSYASKQILKRIEAFAIPGKIKKATGIKKMGKLFRDRDELPTSSDLGADILRALAKSKWLIVVCTPELSDSAWCLEEINSFIKMHGIERVLTVLLKGEPEQAFPDNIRFVKSDDDVIVEREPLAADLRSNGHFGLMRKLRTEKLRLLAPMLGVGFGDLKQRAVERTLAMVIAVSVAAVSVLGSFGGYIYAQNQKLKYQIEETNLQRQIAEENRLTAQKNEHEALRQKDMAEKNLKLAEDNANEALKQTRLAMQNEEIAMRNEEIAKQNETEANIQKELAQKNEAEAKSKNNELLISQSKSYVAKSLEQISVLNLAGASRLLFSALPQNLDNPERPVIQETKNAAYDIIYETVRHAGANERNYVPVAAFPTDGSFVLGAGGSTILLTNGNYVRLYDTKTLRLIKEQTGYVEYADIINEGYFISRDRYSQGPIVSLDEEKFMIPGYPPFIISARTGEIIHEGALDNYEDLKEFGLRRHGNYLQDIRDILTGELVMTHNFEEQHICVFSGDDRFAAVSNGVKTKVLDLKNRKPLEDIIIEDAMEYDIFDRLVDPKVFFSPDSKHLIIYITQKTMNEAATEKKESKRILIYELVNFKKIYEETFPYFENMNNIYLQNYLFEGIDELFSPDGSKMILPVLDSEKKLRLGYFDFEQKTPLDKYFSNVYSDSDGFYASFLPDGENLSHFSYYAAGSFFELTDGDGNRLYWKGSIDGSKYEKIAVTNDGENIIALTSKYSNLYCRLFKLYPNERVVNDAISKNAYAYNDGSGRYIRAVGNDGQFAVFSAISGKKLFDLEKPTKSGKIIYSDSNYIVDSLSNIWNAETGAFYWRFLSEGAISAERLSISEDGERLYVFGQYFEIWQASLKERKWLPNIKTGLLNDPYIADKKGDKMICASNSKNISLYDLKTGLEITSKQYSEALVGVDIPHVYDLSADGTLFAILEKNAVSIFEAVEGNELRKINVGIVAPNHVRFSPDSARLLVTNEQGAFNIFSVETGGLLANFLARDKLKAAAFTPDGQHIFSEIQYNSNAYIVISATTGEIICSAATELLPIWEGNSHGNQIIQISENECLKIPTLMELINKLNEIALGYSFSPEEAVKMGLD